MTRAEALRGLILPGLLSLFALAVLLFLGTWQLQRLAWKENLIAAVTSRVKETPQRLPAAAESLSLDLRNEEYRPYIATGRFLHHDEQGATHRLANKVRMPLRAGESVTVETPGAGGYGDPARRSRDAIAEDARTGKFSRPFIGAHYPARED